MSQEVHDIFWSSSSNERLSGKEVTHNVWSDIDTTFLTYSFKNFV